MLTVRVAASLAAVAAAVGCGSDETVENRDARREIREAVQTAVDAANRADTRAWCRSLYFVAAPGRDEDEFADAEEATSFEDAPPKLRRSCLENRDALRAMGKLQRLQFSNINIIDGKAIVHVTAQRDGRATRDKMLLRKRAGRWLIQHRIQ